MNAAFDVTAGGFCNQVVALKGAKVVYADELCGDLRPSYARGIDPSGDPGRYIFILTGTVEGTGIFDELRDLVDALEPDRAFLDTTAKGPHITFAFDDDLVGLDTALGDETFDRSRMLCVHSFVVRYSTNSPATSMPRFWIESNRPKEFTSNNATDPSSRSIKSTAP